MCVVIADNLTLLPYQVPCKTSDSGASSGDARRTSRFVVLGLIRRGGTRSFLRSHTPESPRLFREGESGTHGDLNEVGRPHVVRPLVALVALLIAYDASPARAAGCSRIGAALGGVRMVSQRTRQNTGVFVFSRDLQDFQERAWKDSNLRLAV